MPIALAVAQIESDFNDSAVSQKGARGVMQIMPKTAYDLFGVDENDLWDPRLNIRLGIRYLHQLYKQYGNRWDLALSHYHGGTLRGTGANARTHAYTRDYVNSVFELATKYDRNQSVIALKERVGRFRENQISPMPARRYAYWSDPTPETEKNWRYHLDVAKKWLVRSEEHSVSGDADTNTGDAYAPVSQVRPSTILNERLRDRGRRFRGLLQQQRRREGAISRAVKKRFI